MDYLNGFDKPCAVFVPRNKYAHACSTVAKIGAINFVTSDNLDAPIGANAGDLSVTTKKVITPKVFALPPAKTLETRENVPAGIDTQLSNVAVIAQEAPLCQGAIEGILRANGTQEAYLDVLDYVGVHKAPAIDQVYLEPPTSDLNMLGIEPVRIPDENYHHLYRFGVLEGVFPRSLRLLDPAEGVGLFRPEVIDGLVDLRYYEWLRPGGHTIWVACFDAGDERRVVTAVDTSFEGRDAAVDHFVSKLLEKPGLAWIMRGVIATGFADANLLRIQDGYEWGPCTPAELEALAANNGDDAQPDGEEVYDDAEDGEDVEEEFRDEQAGDGAAGAPGANLAQHEPPADGDPVNPVARDGNGRVRGRGQEDPGEGPPQQAEAPPEAARGPPPALARRYRDGRSVVVPRLRRQLALHDMQFSYSPMQLVAYPSRAVAQMQLTGGKNEFATYMFYAFNLAPRGRVAFDAYAKCLGFDSHRIAVALNSFGLKGCLDESMVFANRHVITPILDVYPPEPEPALRPIDTVRRALRIPEFTSGTWEVVKVSLLLLLMSSMFGYAMADPASDVRQDYKRVGVTPLTGERLVFGSQDFLGHRAIVGGATAAMLTNPLAPLVSLGLPGVTFLRPSPLRAEFVYGCAFMVLVYIVSYILRNVQANAPGFQGRRMQVFRNDNAIDCLRVIVLLLAVSFWASAGTPVDLANVRVGDLAKPAILPQINATQGDNEAYVETEDEAVAEFYVPYEASTMHKQRDDNRWFVFNGEIALPITFPTNIGKIAQEGFTYDPSMKNRVKGFTNLYFDAASANIAIQAKDVITTKCFTKWLYESQKCDASDYLVSSYVMGEGFVTAGDYLAGRNTSRKQFQIAIEALDQEADYTELFGLAGFYPTQSFGKGDAYARKAILAQFGYPASAEVTDYNTAMMLRDAGFGVLVDFTLKNKTMVTIHSKQLEVAALCVDYKLFVSPNWGLTWDQVPLLSEDASRVTAIKVACKDKNHGFYAYEYKTEYIQVLGNLYYSQNGYALLFGGKKFVFEGPEALAPLIRAAIKELISPAMWLALVAVSFTASRKPSSANWYTFGFLIFRAFLWIELALDVDLLFYVLPVAFVNSFAICYSVLIAAYSGFNYWYARPSTRDRGDAGCMLALLLAHCVLSTNLAVILRLSWWYAITWLAATIVVYVLPWRRGGKLELRQKDIKDYRDWIAEFPSCSTHAIRFRGVLSVFPDKSVSKAIVALPRVSAFSIFPHYDAVYEVCCLIIGCINGVDKVIGSVEGAGNSSRFLPISHDPVFEEVAACLDLYTGTTMLHSFNYKGNNLLLSHAYGREYLIHGREAMQKTPLSADAKDITLDWALPDDTVVGYLVKPTGVQEIVITPHGTHSGNTRKGDCGAIALYKRGSDWVIAGMHALYFKEGNFIYNMLADENGNCIGDVPHIHITRHKARLSNGEGLYYPVNWDGLFRRYRAMTSWSNGITDTKSASVADSHAKMYGFQTNTDLYNYIRTRYNSQFRDGGGRQIGMMLLEYLNSIKSYSAETRPYLLSNTGEWSESEYVGPIQAALESAAWGGATISLTYVLGSVFLIQGTTVYVTLAFPTTFGLAIGNFIICSLAFIASLVYGKVGWLKDIGSVESGPPEAVADIKSMKFLLQILRHTAKVVAGIADFYGKSDQADAFIVETDSLTDAEKLRDRILQFIDDTIMSLNVAGNTYELTDTLQGAVEGLDLDKLEDSIRAISVAAVVDAAQIDRDADPDAICDQCYELFEKLDMDRGDIEEVIKQVAEMFNGTTRARWNRKTRTALDAHRAQKKAAKKAANKIKADQDLVAAQMRRAAVSRTKQEPPAPHDKYAAFNSVDEAIPVLQLLRSKLTDGSLGLSDTQKHAIGPKIQEIIAEFEGSKPPKKAVRFMPTPEDPDGDTESFTFGKPESVFKFTPKGITHSGVLLLSREAAGDYTVQVEAFDKEWFAKKPLSPINKRMVLSSLGNVLDVFAGQPQEEEVFDVVSARKELAVFAEKASDQAVEAFFLETATEADDEAGNCRRVPL